MVSSARLVLVLVLLAGMLAPGSAFSVLSMDVSPAEGVQPKDPIQVSGTLQLASPGTQGFPANHTLNFSTDLLKAAWNFTIVVDGVSRQNLELRGGEAVLYGFSLSYPNDTPVQVEIGLEGSVPPNASPSLTAIQVQEMDEQGLPLPGSAYSRAIRVIRPPAPPPTTAPEPTTLPLPSPSPTATTEPPPASLPTTPPPEPTPLPQPPTPVPTAPPRPTRRWSRKTRLALPRCRAITLYSFFDGTAAEYAPCASAMNTVCDGYGISLRRCGAGRIHGDTYMFIP